MKLCRIKLLSKMKLHSNLFLRKKNKNKKRLEKNLKLNNRRKERLRKR